MEDVIFLDTHVAVWLYAGQLERFSPRVRRDLEAAELLISPAVTLELQYLFEVGRIAAKAAAIAAELQRAIGLRTSDLSFERVVTQALKQTWTRDPFDRLITAQAALGKARLLTKDRDIRAHYSRAYWD